MSKTETDECVWDLETSCEGKFRVIKMFNNKMGVPICEKHLGEHKEVMILVYGGHPIDEVVEMTPEERKSKAIMIALSGISPEDIEL